MLHNMGMHSLPDMHTLGHLASGVRVLANIILMPHVITV